MLQNLIRVEQTHQELDRLQQEITAWLCDRRKRDKLQQYHTQLTVLGTVLTGALAQLRSEIDAISVQQSSGLVYSTCRTYDRRLVWVRRVWSYFRTKFEQRDDSRLGPVLAAADEIVWSCYAEIFQNAALSNPAISRGPVPLPYIEPRYSPQAVPRAEPPPDLKSEIDATFLHDYLNQLPIPVVALPASCIESPWWLIYLGHEVGHHVQYDLLPGWEFVKRFGELLKVKAAAATTSDQADAAGQRWTVWGRELFADTFSILCMGPSTVWSMTELELADERTMLTHKTLYPAPAVRLAFMASLVDQLGISGHGALHGFDPEALVAGSPLLDKNLDLRAQATRDMHVAKSIAAAILAEPFDGLGSLAPLCGWNNAAFAPFGRVHDLVEALRGRAPLYPEKTLRAARLLASGAVRAWTEIATIADEQQRRDERAKLTATILPAIVQSREEGTRAAQPPPMQDATALGNMLARLLADAEPVREGD